MYITTKNVLKNHFPAQRYNSPLNHQVKWMEIYHSPKLGIIQAVLQTLNATFQNTKISTTIYSN